MQSKVSMVMPCYNKAEYIGGMLDSILAQKWDNIELILVNDGSTDATREVISVYEPRFLARGFETIVVDQENRGVAAAVYEGLKRATGEFACQIDADDELTPKYVSTMAGYLEQNPGCDWVVCDSDRALFDQTSHQSSYGVYPYPLVESYFLRRVAPNTWMHMFRISYMLSCGMLENFPTEPRSTQEPQIFLPLALGGKRPFYINRPLYRYVKRENSSITSLVDYSKSMDYLRRREDITAKTIKAITPVNGALLKAHSLLTWHILLSAYKEYDEPEQAGRLAGLINQSGLIERKIDTNAVAQSGFESMARFFGNRVIGYNPPKTDIERKSGGRIIAYAAYGKALHQIRHGLLRSDIRPDVFWDIAAKPGDSIDGIPVIEPDFESLSPNDTCLVLLKDTLLAETVLNGFASKLLEENVWLYYEVLDYLSQYFYCTERAAEVAGI